MLLISYDVPNPPPLQQVRPLHDMLGIALVLGAPGQGQGLARLEVELNPRAENPTQMGNAELEKLRSGNPTGRALPLLEALAAGTPREIALDYLDATLVLRTLAG